MNYWWYGLLIWFLIELGYVMGKQGEPKKGTYSFGYSLFGYGLIVFIVYKAIQTGF